MRKNRYKMPYLRIKTEQSLGRHSSRKINSKSVITDPFQCYSPYFKSATRQLYTISASRPQAQPPQAPSQSVDQVKIDQSIPNEIKSQQNQRAEHDLSLSIKGSSFVTKNRQELGFPGKQPVEAYEQQMQSLNQEYLDDMQRLELKKGFTYKKLRTSLVSKYPFFRKKYNLSGIQVNQDSYHSSLDILSRAESTSDRQKSCKGDFRTHRSKRSKKDAPKDSAVMAEAFFYSKSKRRCYRINAEEQERGQDQTPVSIPKLSYLAYLKLTDHRRILPKKAINGRNMLQRKEDILKLEQEGSKPYLKLRECFEDAVQTCYRETQMKN